MITEIAEPNIKTGLDVIVLAAGKGSRMHSALPKVLHMVAGVPILTRVLTAARQLHPCNIFVVYNDASLPITIKGDDLIWIKQEQRLGTGQAVQLVLDAARTSHVLSPLMLILCADLPLLDGVSLQQFYQQGQTYDLAVSSFWTPHPQGFGRIIRDAQQRFTAIVEETDANEAQKQLQEVNSGVIMARTQFLQRALPMLSNHNQQGEYYLTDVVALAAHFKANIAACMACCATNFMGVNDTMQLAQVERIVQKQQVQTLQWQYGVQFLDPARFDLRGNLKVGMDVVIDVNVVMEGQVILGNNVHIGPFCYLKDVTVGDNVNILAHSVLEGAQLDDGCQVGPFARLRVGSKINANAKIGNFVEIKNSNVGVCSKVNHLSYIGDTDLGSKVNVGAGTITCNYDGQYKYRTVIEDEAFIGSNSALVAPVKIAQGATVGAGSVIVQDVSAGQLALARAKQVTITDWRPKKERNLKHS